MASLFVYWIHVEMVYGVASIWLHKALTFEQAVISYAALCLFLIRAGQTEGSGRSGGRASSPKPRALSGRVTFSRAFASRTPAQAFDKIRKNRPFDFAADNFDNP